VVGVSIVHRYLFARVDVAQGKEGDPFIGDDAHKGVGVARVVDVGGRVTAHSSVDGRIFADGDDFDCLLLIDPRLNTTLPVEDFTGVICNLFARREVDERKAPLPEDAALFDCELTGQVYLLPLKVIRLEMNSMLTRIITRKTKG
jgi:hypothetical protein